MLAVCEVCGAEADADELPPGWAERTLSCPAGGFSVSVTVYACRPVCRERFWTPPPKTPAEEAAEAKLRRGAEKA